MYQYAVVAEVFVDGKGTWGGAVLSLAAAAAAGAVSVDATVLPAETLDAGCRSDSADSASSNSSSPNGFRRTS